MKKINRRRKQKIHKYRYLRFKKELKIKISDITNDILDEKILHPERELKDIVNKYFGRGVIEAWQKVEKGN